jgi:FlgD Ig-like domain
MEVPIMARLSAALVALFFVSLLHSNALAKWIENGVIVSARPSVQVNSSAAPDGAGGAIIAWQDGSQQDIYAQRIDANGNALWAAGGIPICNATNNQWWPSVVSDGAGGAIIAWEDDRNLATTNTDIFAQRVDANGTPMWAGNGVLICNAADQQQRPRLDAVGPSAVLSWTDRRNLVHHDVFVQRINANGTPAWAGNGVAVCTATGLQGEPYIIDDGAGGAIVAWHDQRSGDYDVYARAVNFLGTPVWTVNGVGVAVSAGTSQLSPRIISDGALGAILVWVDYRGGVTSDVYAQRLSPAGAAMWTANGKWLSLTSSNQSSASIASDGAGGAIIAWRDDSGTDADIRAQRVTAAGVSLWAANGVLVCGAPLSQHNPLVVADGMGGAAVAWGSDQNASGISAQRVDASGLTYWNTDGVTVASGAFDRYLEAVVPDGAGGFIASWADDRSLEYNLYAQRIEPRHGYWGRPEPDILSVADVPNDQGGVVALNWLASERDALLYQEISHYSIWRAVDAVPGSSETLATGASLGRLVELSQVGANFNEPAYRVEHTPTVDYFWEFVANQDAIYASGYSFLTPTRADMSGGDPATHYFQVVSHTQTPNVFFPSLPESGASVDNLAPETPLNLTAMRTTGTNAALDWSPSGIDEPDFKEYWVYRAETPGFPTDPSYLLMATPDTMTTDTGASTAMSFYYKVVAVDIHDNTSGDSNEAMISPIPTDIAGDSPSIRSLTMLPNVPNPFSRTTELQIGLPSASDVRIEVFDVAGRRVAARTVARASAGWQRVVFDGRDDAGRTLRSGVYFCRVTAAGNSATRKLVVFR